MARPRHEHPTPAELEVLKILWEQSPMTVREVMDVQNRKSVKRAYTSVMSLLNVMADKGLLDRTPKGRAYVYAPKVKRTKTLTGMLDDLLSRAFDGSASALVAHLLDRSQPSPEELAEIRRALAAHSRSRDKDT
jgi:BlaI family transcriptional regulator, penicillinase repressor